MKNFKVYAFNDDNSIFIGELKGGWICKKTGYKFNTVEDENGNKKDFMKSELSWDFCKTSLINSNYPKFK